MQIMTFSHNPLSKSGNEHWCNFLMPCSGHVPFWAAFLTGLFGANSCPTQITCCIEFSYFFSLLQELESFLTSESFLNTHNLKGWKLKAVLFLRSGLFESGRNITECRPSCSHSSLSKGTQFWFVSLLHCLIKAVLLIFLYLDLFFSHDN